MDRITSTKNPTVRAMRDLKDKRNREETGRILVEGEVMIREALSCGLKIYDLLADERHEEFAADMEQTGAKACIVPRSILEAVCETKTPQGVCASFSTPKPLSLDRMPDVIVALDGVQDPGNVGTIWRTADAAGFQGILLGEGSADPLSPKVLRAAMGSGFRIPFGHAAPLSDALRALSERGYTIIASDLGGGDFYSRPAVGPKLVLVIGNEARGISQSVRECADLRLKLPMRGGAESLNAAIAAAIMMYDLINQGGFAPLDPPLKG